MPQSPASSLEISQILASVRKHGTGLGVWIIASLSLSFLHLNIHCSCWAKLWAQLCKDWKVATFQSWKLKAGLEMCDGHCALGRFVGGNLLQLCLGQKRCRHSLNELARSSTMVTLSLTVHRPHHASSTKKSQKVVAVLPSPGGCSAVWTATRQCNILASIAGWGCEKAVGVHQVPSAQSIQTPSQLQAYMWHRGTYWRSQSWEMEYSP